MKHFLNVCDLSGRELEPVDIISFGSPCQDLSVAGKRAGMKHENIGDEETTRSGLFMEAVRIIREMREKTNGKQPRFALWENVPGAFSSNKGQDFRVVLEELAKVKDETASIPLPDKGKWTGAGSILGTGYSICWRTLDAQYHGVPQRRRRVFLVADFDGESAEKILFKCTGLPGYPAPSGEPGEGTAEGAKASLGAASCYGIQGNGVREDAVTLEPGVAKRLGDHIYEGVSGTLRANAGDNQMSVAYEDRHGTTCAEAERLPKASGFCTEHSAASRTIGYEEERSPTLRAGITPAVLQNNSTSCAEEQTLVLDNYGGQAESVREMTVSPTLKATHYKFPPCVMEGKEEKQ